MERRIKFYDQELYHNQNGKLNWIQGLQGVLLFTGQRDGDVVCVVSDMSGRVSVIPPEWMKFVDSDVDLLLRLAKEKIDEKNIDDGTKDLLYSEIKTLVKSLLP